MSLYRRSRQTMSSTSSEALQTFYNSAKCTTEYERQSADVTRRHSDHLLTLLPPITPSSVVHDNACGPGIFVRSVLSLPQFRVAAESPPSRIEATDFAEGMINALRSIISREYWHSVHAAVVDSQDLQFKDGTFTHSITSFGIFLVPNAEKASGRSIARSRPVARRP